MSIFSCGTLRAGVVVSIGLLLLGIVFVSPTVIFSAPLELPVLFFHFAGFAAILASPVVLLVTLLLSLFPSVNDRLNECQH